MLRREGVGREQLGRWRHFHWCAKGSLLYLEDFFIVGNLKIFGLSILPLRRSRRLIKHGGVFAEVRFKNNGLDSIEVQDNGQGIAPENYESIGMR